MKSIMKNILLLSILIISFSSCFTERIELDLNENNEKVVVKAWLTDLDEPQIVYLEYTTNYLGDPKENFIKGAHVELRNDEEIVVLTEQDNGEYFLPDNWLAKIGMEYTLTVKVEDITYEATAKMYSTPEIENLYYKEDINEDDSTYFAILFSIEDPEGLGDGYFVKNYKLGHTDKDLLTSGDAFDDEYVDGKRIKDIEVTSYDYELGDTSVVELISIGKEAAQFIRDIKREEEKGSLFDSPPVNTRTNISNGAIGYFMMGQTKREMIIIN